MIRTFLGIAPNLAVLALATAPVDGPEGTCVGDAWIEGKATARSGPDFRIYDFEDSGGSVSVYIGCCSQVSSDDRTLFVRQDGVRIFRTSDDDGFSGYLAIARHRHEGVTYKTQLHFFGVGLKGTDSDRSFFRRVRFGSFAAERCEKL